MEKTGSVAIIGKRIANARLEMNLSRRDLAGMLGVSCEQVEKYEAGKDRMPAGRLYQLSEVLGLPVTEFFKQPN